MTSEARWLGSLGRSRHEETDWARKCAAILTISMVLCGSPIVEPVISVGADVRRCFRSVISLIEGL